MNVHSVAFLYQLFPHGSLSEGNDLFSGVSIFIDRIPILSLSWLHHVSGTCQALPFHESLWPCQEREGVGRFQTYQGMVVIILSFVFLFALCREGGDWCVQADRPTYAGPRAGAKTDHLQLGTPWEAVNSGKMFKAAPTWSEIQPTPWNETYWHHTCQFLSLYSPRIFISL